jgi:hypothetical protein
MFSVLYATHRLVRSPTTTFRKQCPFPVIKSTSFTQARHIRILMLPTSKRKTKRIPFFKHCSIYKADDANAQNTSQTWCNTTP